MVKKDAETFLISGDGTDKGKLRTFGLRRFCRWRRLRIKRRAGRRRPTQGREDRPLTCSGQLPERNRPRRVACPCPSGGIAQYDGCRKQSAAHDVDCHFEPRRWPETANRICRRPSRLVEEAQLRQHSDSHCREGHSRRYSRGRIHH